MHLEMNRMMPSKHSIGSVRNIFVGATVISSLATVLLIAVLPIMLCRLNALYDTVSVEKMAFQVSSFTFLYNKGIL
jgi:hypothetical protein